MKPSLVHHLLIVAVAAATSLTALGSTALWDEDEAFFATAAAEMHRHNDWVVPTFNEELFAHKPPFMYWMMRIGYSLFGLNELGARFGSAVFGILTAVLVYHIGRILFGRRAGLWSSLSLSTCLMWNVVTRAATADAYLVCFIAAALLVYVNDVFGTGLIHRTGIPATEPDRSTGAILERWLPARWSTFVVLYGLMGLAVLVKGPIGVLLPGATIGLFVLWQMPYDASAGRSRFGRFAARLQPIVGTPFLQTFWRMRPLTAIAMVLLVAGPWFVLVSLKTNGEFPREFFGVHNFGRFVQPMENHRGPIFYYLPVMLIGFFPWTMFAMPTLIHAARSASAGDQRPKFQFLACWAVVMVGFFSIARTKLPNYVLPAYPALALLTAAWLDAWLAHREKTWQGWPALSFGTLAAVGAGLIVILPVVGNSAVAGRPLLESMGVNGSLSADVARLGWLGVVPAMGGLIAWRLAATCQRRNAMLVTGGTSMLFTASVLIVAAGVLNKHQTSPGLTAGVHDPGLTAVASFRHSPPSLIFYAARRVERLRTAEQAREFLNGPGRRCLITTDTGLAQIREVSSRPLAIVDQRPRFPRTGDVLTLCNDRPMTFAGEDAPPKR